MNCEAPGTGTRCSTFVFSLDFSVRTNCYLSCSHHLRQIQTLYVCFFFLFSSKNPEEAELEDTLNQVVRYFDLCVLTNVHIYSVFVLMLQQQMEKYHCTTDLVTLETENELLILFQKREQTSNNKSTYLYKNTMYSFS